MSTNADNSSDLSPTPRAHPEKPAMPFIDPDSHPAMIRHGLKTGIAAVLAYGVAHLLDLKFGYCATLSAVIVMQVYVADSVQMCLYRFSGTAVGAAIGLAAILLFPQTQPMTVLALFLSVAFCAYMTRYNARYRMAAITVCIVVLAGYDQDDRIVFGMLRVVEIGVGVAAAFVVSIALWPVRAGTALKARLMMRFGDCARHYEAIMNAFLAMQSGLAPSLLDQFQTDIREDRALFQKVLRHERRMYHEDTDLLGLKVRTLEKCHAHLQTMLQALNSEQGQGYEIIMDRELRELAAVTVESMRGIASGRTPSTDLLAKALNESETRLHELRKDGATRRFHLQKLLQFFAFYHSAQSMGRDILLYGQNPLFSVRAA
ncbi:MAG: FUSC family protein [Desulfomicrobium apsheronum]|nr:FUSC family protein [Desulfomicrobium apsheronum]